jgi:hypothetical protein
MNSPTVASVTVELAVEDTLAFELGRDHARYGVAPTLPQAYDSLWLRNGLVAGRASAASRLRTPNRAVQLWLKLRLQAWCEGQSVEPVQVTPRFVQQLEVSHCPITRAPLVANGPQCNDAAIARVRHDAAYAAGNLAIFSAKAQRASSGVTRVQAQELARRLDAETGFGTGGLGGLTGAQWARVATLASFVEPLTHEQACLVPLLVLPPNRLRLFNPAQALQAFVSRQLLAPGWSLRMSRIEALLPAAQRSFQTFFHALLPRVLEAGRDLAAHEQRWAIEDAWRQPFVQQRWWGFARQLSAAQCEALVVRAHARRLRQGLLHALSDRAAVDGWDLEQLGQVSGDVTVPRPTRRPLRPESRWLPVAQQAPRQAVLPLQ